MNNKPYIEFKKERELGDILSDTFAFFRSEFKPFFSTIFKIIGPYLAVMLICYGFYFYAYSGILNFTDMDASPLSGFSPVLLIVVILGLVISVVASYVMAQASILYYIKSYANNRGQANFDEIKNNVYNNFWSFIGLGFLVALSVGIGLLFCFIPGIYLYVPLALSFSIMVFNQKDVTDSYQYSFTLVKDNWWITFATLIVIGIIVSIASYAFSVPTAIYTWIKMGVFSGAVDAESVSSIGFDPVYIILNVLSAAVQFLLNMITVVASVFIYFNLNEKKNFTGTYEIIDNLGKSEE